MNARTTPPASAKCSKCHPEQDSFSITTPELRNKKGVAPHSHPSQTLPTFFPLNTHIHTLAFSFHAFTKHVPPHNPRRPLQPLHLLPQPSQHQQHFRQHHQRPPHHLHLHQQQRHQPHRRRSKPLRKTHQIHQKGQKVQNPQNPRPNPQSHP